MVDVVPAIFGGWSNQNTPIYWMPNGEGWWMNSSPPAHNTYIKKAEERSGGKLKRTAKLIKYWRECRDPKIPISSFHIEMLLAAHRYVMVQRDTPSASLRRFKFSRIANVGIFKTRSDLRVTSARLAVRAKGKERCVPSSILANIPRPQWTPSIMAILPKQSDNGILSSIKSFLDDRERRRVWRSHYKIQ